METPARRSDDYIQAKAHPECRWHGGVGGTARRSRRRRAERSGRPEAQALSLLRDQAKLLRCSRGEFFLSFFCAARCPYVRAACNTQVGTLRAVGGAVGTRRARTRTGTGTRTCWLAGWLAVCMRM